MPQVRISHLSKIAFGYMALNVAIFVWMQKTNVQVGEDVFAFDDARLLLERERRLMTRRKADFYSYQQTEINRTGPGEGGKTVKLTREEVALIESEMKKEGFSRYANSLVSLDRSLKDYRDDVCKKASYEADLPTASVIIIFRNELQRVVLRTAHSVINRTPPRYLKEVILVDDASDREELLKPLDEHIKKHWPEGLVRVIRLPIRSGLIRTRLAGVAAATGDVVVIMDGHMEVTKGWIEPLLARIKQNKRVLLSSLIDVIDPKYMSYRKSEVYYQTFSWNLEYVWRSVPKDKGQDPLQPLPTYALVGCMMVMHRATFLEMGAYDTGMDVWGGENVELPIRMWMCGGRVEIILCSRVAHTYRAGLGRPWNSSNNDYFQTNIQRIAEVWLDEYKDQFYLTHQSLQKNISHVRANVTDRIALRKRLGCKSFRWLLDMVKPPMFVYTSNVTAWGQLKNTRSDKCLDSLNIQRGHSGDLGVYPCHRAETMGYTQLFALTQSKQLRRELHCVASAHLTPGKNVTFYHECDEVPSQQWTYDKELKHVVHELSKMCLEVVPSRDVIQYVVLNTCTEKPTQQWTWKTYNIKDLLTYT